MPKENTTPPEAQAEPTTTEALLAAVDALVAAGAAYAADTETPQFVHHGDYRLQFVGEELASLLRN